MLRREGERDRTRERVKEPKREISVVSLSEHSCINQSQLRALILGLEADILFEHSSASQ